MGNLRRAVFRWRRLVLGLELLTAAAFAGLGWRLIGDARPAAAAVVTRIASTGIPPRYRLTLPVGTASPGPNRAAPGAHPASITPSLVQRINADDLALYHQQWRALQILSEGIRRYLERWVLPPLFDPGLRG